MFAWTSLMLTVVSFARVLVLFLESVAAVRDERSHDAELLDVCARGEARGSSKMRAACLQAQADRASPLLLKAMVRAVSVAFKEFSDTVATPFGFATMILFVLSSLLLPVVPWVRAVLTIWAGDDDDDQELHRDSDLEHHIVVLTGDQSWMPQKPAIHRRVARKLVGSKMRLRSSSDMNGGQQVPSEEWMGDRWGRGRLQEM